MSCELAACLGGLRGWSVVPDDLGGVWCMELLVKEGVEVACRPRVVFDL